MVDDTKYNGWTNYETWAVALHISADRCTCMYWRNAALEIWRLAKPDRLFPRIEKATLALASRIRHNLSESNPLADDCSAYAFLLIKTLSLKVNYVEIAGNWLDEFAREEQVSV